MSSTIGLTSVARVARAAAVARWAAPGVIVAGAIVAYLPVIVVPYAFEDDYWVLSAVHGLGGASVWSAAVVGGRPIQGALLTGIFRLVPDIDTLRLVRVLGVLGAVLLGLLLYYAMRRNGFNRWVAAAAALTIVMLPSFQVYTAWAVVFEAPYAAILAGLAWFRVPRALQLRSRAALLRGVEASALLLFALFTYQPAAMFFWVFAAVELLRPDARFAVAARKFGAGLAVGLIAMLGDFVWVKSVHLVYGTGSDRSGLNRDFVGKLEWFWREPLRNALNLFELAPTWSLAAAIVIVAAAGMFLLHAPKRKEAFGFLAIAFALLPLSYLPSLVLREDWASYRSLGALSALAMLYTWLGLWGIVRAPLALAALAVMLSFLALALVLIPLAHLPDPPAPHAASLGALASWQRLVPLVLLLAAFVAVGFAAMRDQAVTRFVAASGIAAVALAGVLLAARNVTTLFVKPDSVEVELLRSTLQSPQALDAKHVLYIKARFDRGAAPVVRYDEFGLPSSYAPWVPTPAVVLIQRERGRTSPPHIDVLAWDQIGPHPRAQPHTAVVDMRKLRERRVGWSLWTLHAAGQ